MSRFILAFQGPSSAKFSNPKIFQKRAVSSLKAHFQGYFPGDSTSKSLSKVLK
jgi:hypothetical protein